MGPQSCPHPEVAREAASLNTVAPTGCSLEKGEAVSRQQPILSAAGGHGCTHLIQEIRVSGGVSANRVQRFLRTGDEDQGWGQSGGRREAGIWSHAPLS